VVEARQDQGGGGDEGTRFARPVNNNLSTEHYKNPNCANSSLAGCRTTCLSQWPTAFKQHSELRDYDPRSWLVGSLELGSVHPGPKLSFNTSLNLDHEQEANRIIPASRITTTLPPAYLAPSLLFDQGHRRPEQPRNPRMIGNRRHHRFTCKIQVAQAPLLRILKQRSIAVTGSLTHLGPTTDSISLKGMPPPMGNTGDRAISI
jgi:hypothetical protein